MKKKLLIVLSIIILLGIGVLIYLFSIPRVAVLGYHNLASNEEKKLYETDSLVLNLDKFEAQLDYLKKHNYKTLTLDEFYCWKKKECNIPRKSVLITFDDGYLSNYHYAFEMLKERNMNAVVFVIGSSIKESNDEWNEKSIGQYMSYEELEDSKENYPNIEFASHSYNLHFSGSVRTLSYEELNEDCKKMLSIIDSQYYAYPYGSKSDNMVKALKNNDYKLAFGFGPRENHRKATRNDDDYLISRLNIDDNMPLWKFGLRLIIPY